MRGYSVTLSNLSRSYPITRNVSGGDVSAIRVGNTAGSHALGHP